MEEIYGKIQCRESQVNDLLDLLGDGDEPLPYSIFISGNMATGKSLCVETVLQHLGFKHVVINCIECYSQKILFENILYGLYDEETDIKCETISDLISHIKNIENGYRPLIVVFDKAERMRSMGELLMSAFLRFRELCNKNICCIFISHLIYDNFHFHLGVREPIKLYFPNYTKEELFKIIFLYRESFIKQFLRTHNVKSEIKRELEKPELFANFLNAFLSVFYRPCRDLIELQHMARVNYVKYCEPLITKDIPADDLLNLWRHISPILKTSLEQVYLRISDSTPTSPNKENSKQDVYNYDNIIKEELTSTKMFAQSFELPYYAKFLLIAAYIASYNPPKEDKRLFMKNHGKQRKRAQQVRAKAKVNEELNTRLGPKVFTLDRLLAIFYAILEEKIGLTSNLLAQIATLMELKLIVGSKEIDLDCPKYKCLVGYEFIIAIAETVGFNIRKYLKDFI